MQYTRLGQSGLIVSRLSFGAMTFSAGNRDIPGLYNVAAEEADRLVGQALDAGINFFDTADIYAGGESEEMLGRALKPRRNEVVITTKVAGRMGPGFNEAGLSRRNILSAVDNSLRRLGTDWIDVYVAHQADPHTPIEETLLALDAVVRAGKVRYLGFSNWPAWRVATAMGFIEREGLARFTHGQMYYSLLGRDIEHEVIPMMQHHGLGLTIWSPLAGGFLSGKYRRGAAGEPDSRYASFDMLPLDRELAFKLLDQMDPIAQAHGASVAQVAIAWLLAKPAVTSVILGAAKTHQLADNLKAAELTLSPEELALLDSASETRVPYPAWFVGRYGDRKMAEALAWRK